MILLLLSWMFRVAKQYKKVSSGKIFALQLIFCLLFSMITECAIAGGGGGGGAGGCTPNITSDGFAVVDAATSSGGGCTTLTTNTTNQRGCAWDANSTLNFAAGFSYDFTVNLGSNNGGADGIAFVIQNDPNGLCACGSTGGAMGAGGISNSLAIEVDTYLNTEDRDDGMAGTSCFGGTEPDHLDIWTNGNVNPVGDNSDCNPPGARVVPSAVPLTNGGSDYNIENGANHLMRVTWTPGAPGTITVTILNAAGTTTYGTISYSFDPSSLFGTTTPYFGFTGSTGGLSNNQSFCLPASLLPVDLVAFNSECREENKIKLNWATASERNNNHFTIERSTDGKNFEEIGKVQGAGNSSTRHHYEWMDVNAGNGRKYYRLKQTSYNNISVVHRLIVENCKGPGPGIQVIQATASSIIIEVDNVMEDENVAVQLYDLLGRKVLADSIAVSKNGDNQKTITTKQLSGVHIVAVTGKSFSAFQKVMIW